MTLCRPRSFLLRVLLAVPGGAAGALLGVFLVVLAVAIGAAV